MPQHTRQRLQRALLTERLNPEAVTRAGHAYRDVSGWRTGPLEDSDPHQFNDVNPSWRCVKAKFHYAIQVADLCDLCDLIEDL